MLQGDITNKQKQIDEQNNLVTKLSAKIENFEEKVKMLTEQIQIKEQELLDVSDNFNAKLLESQQYYDDIIQQREVEITSLKELFREKDAELSARDDDIRAIMEKHEEQISKLATKGEVNVQDEVLKMMDEKVRDTNEALSSKVKVIEMLQREMAEKEKEILEKGTSIKNLNEKLAMTAEQMTLMQENFVALETEWKEEKLKLEAESKEVTEGHEVTMMAKLAEIERLQETLTHFQTVYTETSSQCNTLQEQYHSVQSKLQELEQSQHAQGEQSHTDITELQANLDKKQHELDELNEKTKASLTKQEAKFTKMKAAATAKVKKLEKQLQEMKEVNVMKYLKL